MAKPRMLTGVCRAEQGAMEIFPVDTSNSFHLLHVRDLRTHDCRLFICENGRKLYEIVSWPAELAP